MIEYKDGKKYWNRRECDANFVNRTLADMFPQDYEKYIKDSRDFIINNTVLHCKICYYEWVHNQSKITPAQCPSCKSFKTYKL